MNEIKDSKKKLDPMDFEFKGSLTSMYRQIGNAVPVKFAEKIASGFHKK